MVVVAHIGNFVEEKEVGHMVAVVHIGNFVEDKEVADHMVAVAFEDLEVENSTFDFADLDKVVDNNLKVVYCSYFGSASLYLIY
jgi:hypothetical protein